VIDAELGGSFHGDGECCFRRNVQWQRGLVDDGLFVVGDGVFERATDGAGGIVVENDTKFVFLSGGENMDGMACVNDGKARHKFNDVADLDGFKSEPISHAICFVENIIDAEAMETNREVHSFIWISAAAPATGLFTVTVYIVFERMPSGGKFGDITCVLEDFIFAVAKAQVQMVDGMFFRQEYAEFAAGGREDGKFGVYVGVGGRKAEFHERADGLIPLHSELRLVVDLNDFGGLLPFFRLVSFDFDRQGAKINNGRERIFICMEAIRRNHTGNG